MTKRALLSVSNKSGLIEFARGLHHLDYELISTGGTLRTLQEAGLPAIPVEQVTSFPEILEGRVKTLHPFIHGGLLAKVDNPDHQEQLKEHGIQPIDIVVVNLYPFKETLERVDATKEDMIENIDIGGPTMLRAAAKNYQYVTVVVDPNDYDTVLAKLNTNTLDLVDREELAAKVFRHTAQYDALIAQYFMKETSNPFPETLTVTYEKVQTLRYGENPHQEAAFYKQPLRTTMSLAESKQLHGKDLSYNNIQDANACIEIIAEYNQPAAVAVKHMNPCGIGVSDTLEDAFQKAYDADPVSIFGGIVALNREVTEAVAEKLSQIFLEIVIAPSFTEDALAILTKKKNIRLLELPLDDHNGKTHQLVSVHGGILVQDTDLGHLDEKTMTVPTKRKPTEAEMASLTFAWKAVKHVKSNAIVLAKDEQTIGVGAGQMNRVGAAKIAIEQAGDKAKGAVMASDAFFPMPDTVEAAAKAGITAMIQPGGSKRDQDSIDMCDQYGIAMVFTGMRHFKH